MHLELDTQMTRADVGPTKIFEKMGKPEGLNDGIIRSWREGNSKSADPDLFNLTLNTCKVLPDANAKINITEEKRLELDTQMTRAGVSARILFEKMDKPEELTDVMIGRWRSGITSSADLYLFNLALNTCKTLPDAKETIEITEEKRLELDAQMTRAGVGARILFEKMGKPEGLNDRIISSWREGNSKSADPDLFNLTLNTCKVLPDANAKINITEEKRLELDTQMTRAGVSARILFEKMSKPKGLSTGIINGWRFGRTSSADLDLFNLALITCKALPTKGLKPYGYDESNSGYDIDQPEP